MTSDYSRNVLRVAVAQICQTIGWHSVHASSLEVMVDLMQEYFLKLSRLTQQYSNILGRCESNLDDLGLAFAAMNIDLNELLEYVKNVEPVPCVLNPPKLPVHRDNHLNFMKPGSREVLRRPIHIHEHLPPMYPEEEEYPTETEVERLNRSSSIDPMDTSMDQTLESNNENSDQNSTFSQGVFKRPGDINILDKHEDRPLREIHSVIMTTSGYLSTAREGKLPDAKTPQQARADTPSPTPPPVLPEEPPPVLAPPEPKIEKKPKRPSKRNVDGKSDKENKKKKMPKDNLFSPDKKTSLKESAKMKFIKSANKVLYDDDDDYDKDPDYDAGPSREKLSKQSKHCFYDSLKSDVKKTEIKEESIDKLPTEPDKQKLNFFKKISKAKEDRDKDLPIESIKPQIPINVEVKNEDIKPVIQPMAIINNNLERVPKPEFLPKSSELDVFDNLSSPGTPRTPKTPEFSIPTPTDQKKKRKEKSGKKKEKEPKVKTPKSGGSKKQKLSYDMLEHQQQLPERPKTPQASEPPINRDLNPNQPAAPILPFPLQVFPNMPGFLPRQMFPNNYPSLNPLRGMPVPPVMGPNPMNPYIMRQRFQARPPQVDNRFSQPPFPQPELYHQQTAHMYQQPMQKPEKIYQPPPPMAAPFVPASVPTPAPPPPPREKLITKILEQSPMHFAPPIMEHQQIYNNPVPPQFNPIATTSAMPANNPLMNTMLATVKPPKPEKPDKKSKEHKKEKKDKLKKKKEKKEKHKEKGEKIKEKKDKSSKKEKLQKIKEKKEKKEKRKEKEIKKLQKEQKEQKEEKLIEPKIESVPKLTLKLGGPSGSPRPPTPDSALMKKITIKPPKKPEEDIVREPSPELAKISALVTRPPKVKSSKVKANPVVKKEDHKEDKENGGNSLAGKSVVTVEGGKQVWICPACGKQDDGSPMIGCDDCDAWYHWVCVGIQVAPADNEDWYCRMCLAKKQEQYHDKKKKKRKKKLKESA